MSSIYVVYNDMNNFNIRNFTFNEFLSIFHTTRLDISTFWLINTGYDDKGNKKYVHLIIRACQIRPFFGPHYISLLDPDGQTLQDVWVNSLTYLRKHIFKFTDRLSFERSTYLMPYESGDVMIRLKSIRSLLTIPLSGRNKKVPRPLKKSNPMRTHLLETCVQNMISYLDREKDQSLEETIQEAQTFVEEYCKSLLTSVTVK